MRLTIGVLPCWMSIFLMLTLFLFLSKSGQAANTTKEFVNYFSADYAESRRKFLQSAKMVGASIESYCNPINRTNDTPLCTDVAIIGPGDAPGALILGSGTHGVEGFAGSAIQTGLLRQGIADNISPDTRLILIHAINPYGFAYLRRVNEDNVDINRNFVDHAKSYPANPGYEALADALEPERLSLWRDLAARLKIYWYRIFEGKEQIRHAITQGQYTHPKGLFYGGNAATWSNSIFTNILKKHVSNAQHVIYIGFHTGLGSYGNAEVIMNVPTNSDAYIHAKECWGSKVRSTVEGYSVSVDITGPLKLAVPKILPNAKVTAVSLEFGTFPGMEVLWAMRAENWLHHYPAAAHSKSEKIKSELLNVFYPNDLQWKSDVWKKGRLVVNESLGCLGK